MGNNIKPPVIDKLPQMEIRRMINVWTNAVKIKADDKKKDQHEDAIMVLEAIDQEWEKIKKDGGRIKRHDDPDPNKVGMLSYLGYHVGQTQGESPSVRRAILSQVFKGALPPVFPNWYMDQWNDPRTAGRLMKMANSIATFANDAKPKKSARRSVQEWQDDLQFLYETFYIGKFGFYWPNTS